jgi:cytochrome c oxidase subunit II
MALLLVIVLVLIVVGSGWFFTAGWIPSLAAASGQATDDQIRLNFLLLGTVFLVSHAALAAFLWHYREQRRNVSTSQPRAQIEIAWALAATILFVGLNIAGTRLWAKQRIDGPALSANPLMVEVTGAQFRWYFRQPGTDGIFGRIDPRLIDASLGNPLGIDPDDAAAGDDIVTTQLVVQRGREIEVHLRAQDVIHSFFVPALRIKQDAVPGAKTVIHFTPHRSGDYEIVCAELCGLGHHQMNAKLKVMDEAR